MINWKWWRTKRTPLVFLAVMRQADMLVAHPDTDYTKTCSACKEPVGIYPSGQRIIKKNPTTILVCNRCNENQLWPLAPGAEIEPLQSHPVKKS